ncbi:N-acetyllactosaminide beta-1,3-N-acetylglucosaminyltransferase 3-like isoform X2 [Dermacentor albipictus]|uniref:N-acetyllactosaminide beta-1,3-N-acetylglucosaminyltransferase 3-like isoform X2 n=1 Tax=Dermacentor albipictus TaxID=60249 RepID=UPI0038FCCD9C
MKLVGTLVRGACSPSPPVATRQWTLLATLAAFTLFNVSYWYSQRDCWKRISPPGVLRLSATDRVLDRRQGTTTRPSDVPLELLFWRPVEALLRGYGRLPFPVENVSFLPVAYSVVHRCRIGGPLSHVFFVHSAPNNWAKRRLLRETIGDVAMATKHSWTTVFFVGLSRNLGVQQKVLDEAEQHGDLVMLPYLDAYRNLTYKYVYGMKWTMDNCPSARYVVKMDDDMVINLTKLVAYLKRRTPTEPVAFHCYVWTNMMVERNTDSPWYIPKKMYRKSVFSRYCSGSVVLFASKVMEAVYNASFEVPFMPVDDVYVTGEAAKKARVGHVRLNRYYSLFDDRWREVARGKYLFAHVSRAKNRRRCWDIIMRELREPTLAFLDYETSSQEGATSLNRSDESAAANDEGAGPPSAANLTSHEMSAKPPLLYEDTYVLTRDVASASVEAESQKAAGTGDGEVHVRDRGDTVERSAQSSGGNVVSRSRGEPTGRDDADSAAFIVRGQG